MDSFVPTSQETKEALSAHGLGAGGWLLDAGTLTRGQTPVFPTALPPAHQDRVHLAECPAPHPLGGQGEVGASHGPH